MSARYRRQGGTSGSGKSIEETAEPSAIPAGERNLTETRTGNAGDIDLPPGIPLLVQAKCGRAPGYSRPWRPPKARAGFRSP